MENMNDGIRRLGDGHDTSKVRKPKAQRNLLPLKYFSTKLRLVQ